MNFRYNFTPCKNLKLENIAILRDETVVTKNISFQIRSNQSLWLKGRNGSGKSTLLKSIAGIFNSYYGEMYYNDVNLINIPRYDKFAWLGHKNALTSGLNVNENIKLFCFNRNIIFPSQELWIYVGLDDIRSKKVSKLSSGQSRHLALFRIFISNLPIWLLDEPEDCLDNNRKLILAQACQYHLKSGGIIIVVSHNIPTWQCQLEVTI